MTAATKFLFDTVFDADGQNDPPEPVEEIEPEGEIPTFSMEDIDQARSEGFAAGREEGIREAANATESRIMETVAMIAERLSELFRVQEEATAAAAQNAISVATAITRKVFPDLARRNALGEVGLVLDDAMEKVADEPRVVMRVNDQLHEPLAQRLDALAERHGFQGQVVLRPDAEIPPGDCRLEWSNGGCERDTAALWRDIDAIIERYLGPDAGANGDPGSEDADGHDEGDGDRPAGGEPDLSPADDVRPPPEEVASAALSAAPVPEAGNQGDTPVTPPVGGDSDVEQPVAPRPGG